MCTPEAAIAITVISTAVTAYGQHQQGQALKAQYAYQQGIERNKQIAIEQDKQIERDNERLKQRLISEEGRQRRGDIRVAQAALGQLVDEGSAQDITDQLAGEVAFKKLLSERESNLRIRNLEIERLNSEGEVGLLRLKSKDAQRAAAFGVADTLLTSAGTLSRNFKFDKNGKIVFRTYTHAY